MPRSVGLPVAGAARERLQLSARRPRELADVDADELTLQLDSRPFPVRGYKRIAVKVVDVYGNESTVVRALLSPNHEGEDHEPI